LHGGILAYAAIVSALVEQLVKRLTLTSTSPPGDGVRRAAVAVLLHDTPERPRVLLMKRADREGDPWSGHISLPGGGYHAHEDTSLLDTAIRETHEELGLSLDRSQLLGNLATLGPRSAGNTPIEVTPYVFRCDATPEIVCGPEALAAFWLPLDVALSGALDKPYLYPGSQMTFPSWDFEGHVIWGLTRRILDDLIAAAG
jgi:8-oxo-dGTP pyrophosphatase MutT (NUDIX family)